MAGIKVNRLKSGTISVSLAESYYDKEKKYASQKRKYLGVLDEKNNELLQAKGIAELNDKEKALLDERGIKYCGRRAERAGRKRKIFGLVRNGEIATPENITNVTEPCCVEALQQLSDQMGLTKSLEQAFGVKVAQELLLLSIHQVCEGNALYLAEHWLENTTGQLTGWSDSTLGRRLSELGNNISGIDEFFRAWIKSRGMPRGLIHDTTSISTYSQNLELAEWGYNRDKEDLPQLNLALAVERNSQLPLWYRTISGSIPDVVTLKGTSELLLELGLKDFSYSLDRGYYSASNVADALEAGIDFDMGLPISGVQAKKLLKTHLSELNSVAGAFADDKDILRHAEGIFCAIMKDESERKLKVHIYKNNKRAAEQERRLISAVLELENKAKRTHFARAKHAREWIDDNARGMAKFLKPIKIGTEFMVIRDNEAIDRKIETLGVFMLLCSNPAIDKETALSNSRARDMAEKIFDSYKNANGNHRLHTGDDDNAAGRIFLGFLSVILRSLLENKMRDAELLKKYSVPEALALLRKIKQVTFSSGTKWRSDIPKKAREIATALDYNPALSK